MLGAVGLVNFNRSYQWPLSAQPRHLPVALAKVRSQSDLPTFVIARCRPTVYGVHDLRPGKPPEGELDGSEGHEGGQSFRKVLEILGETPVASEPGEGALDHPAARQNDKALYVVVRLTISRRSRGTFGTAASTCQAL